MTKPAVALVVSAIDTTILWLADGRCTGIEVERGNMEEIARSRIEARCCPGSEIAAGATPPGNKASYPATRGITCP